MDEKIAIAGDLYKLLNEFIGWDNDVLFGTPEELLERLKKRVINFHNVYEELGVFDDIKTLMEWLEDYEALEKQLDKLGCEIKLDEFKIMTMKIGEYSAKLQNYKEYLFARNVLFSKIMILIRKIMHEKLAEILNNYVCKDFSEIFKERPQEG